MSTDVVGTATAGAGRIGRYFSVVSALPSTVFLAYVYVLIRTGALSGPVRWSEVADFDPAQLLVVGLAALVLSLALNPLQVELLRIFEGYWGSGRVAQQLATIRIAHHRKRRSFHRRAAADARRLVDSGQLETDAVPPEMIGAAVRSLTHRRDADVYPDKPSQILPTRLGNVLRSYEARVGRPYGIEAIRTVPRLAMVAGEREVAYMQNQRTQLELAVRTALLGLLAAVVTVFFFWRHGWWLLVALVPYAVAFLAYRGAVALAHEYGLSMAVMVDVSRFRLYDTLRLPSPRNHTAELAQNRRLMAVFGFGRADLGSYAERPADPPPQTEPPPDPESA